MLGGVFLGSGSVFDRLWTFRMARLVFFSIFRKALGGLQFRALSVSHPKACSLNCIIGKREIVKALVISALL